jgi:photosystem II stability/assembly factor-like uncharacterized protein
MPRVVLTGAIVAALTAVTFHGAAASPGGRGTSLADQFLSTSYEAPVAGLEPGESESGPAEPGDFFLDKTSSGEYLTNGQFEQAALQAANIPASGGTWENVGATNVGGRVTDLVVDTSRPDTIFAATAGGGVWTSTDGGSRFSPAWPNHYTQSIGAIARGSDGVLWVGTGEANPPGGGITYFGNGIYKSTDSGATWQNVGLEHSGAVGRMAVDPSNPKRVFVAASGTLYAPGGERGVYRTTDGGATWQLVLPPANDTTGAVDLAIDPTNPNRIFAAMWDHKRTPYKRTYGGTGSGLFRSVDGGNTWQRLENVTKLSTNDTTGLRSDESLGRIGIGLAPSDPNRIYVISGTQFGKDKGFYVSNDGGDSFAAGGTAGGNSGFEWWFGRLFVDPVNKDHLFNADVSLRESTNGGTTWAAISGPHADQHIMAWDPNVANRVYLGNDGGVYRSDSNGATRTFVLGTYMPWNQLYRMDIAFDDPTRIVQGFQDQGCARSWTPTRAGKIPDGYNSYGCGDGHFVLIDPTDHNIYYGCSQNGACTRYTDTGSSTTTRNIKTGTHSIRNNTDNPIVIDPNNPAVIYYGGNVLDRSTDRGQTWTQISPTDPNYLTGTFNSPEEVDPAYKDWGTITSIGLSKTDTKLIYVGTDTGRLWKTTDLGATWTEFTGKGLPDRWVTAVVVDPKDANHVWATFSGFRNAEAAANVFETRDGGNTWTNISRNLPNAPVNAALYDNATSVLYIGSDLGVFMLKPGKQNWERFGFGLPPVTVLDLRMHEATHSIYAATFGRGAYRINTAVPGADYQLILADVQGSPLSMEVLDGSLVTLPSVTLNGFDQFVNGSLNRVRVVDPRGTAPGWNVTGQVSDFVGQTGLILADNLGWSPTASVINGNLPTAPGTQSQVTAGATAAPGTGTGLGNARSLCSSGVGVSAGAFECGGGLTLGVPGATRTGTYTGVLTLTLV